MLIELCISALLLAAVFGVVIGTFAGIADT